MFVHTVIMVIEPHMKQGRQHKLISTIFLATSVTKKLDHNSSLLKKGERIWLENLDGYTDLRGLTITALGENGEIIWTASIPDEEENKGFTHLVNDDWEITNIE